MTTRHRFPFRATSSALLTLALVAAFAVPAAHAEDAPAQTPAEQTPPTPEWASELERSLAEHQEPAPTAAEMNAAEEPPLCDVTWVGGSGGRWNEPGNWSPAAVPTSAQTVCATDSEVYVPNGVSAEAGRLIADATVAIEGSLTVNGPSSVEALHLTDRYDRGAAPRFGIGEGVAVTVQELEIFGTKDAAISGGTLVVVDRFLSASSWASITSFLITEPTSTTDVGGTKSRLEISGGATLWGEWTVDEGNYVGVSTRAGWGQPSSLNGKGELEVHKDGRMLILGALDFGSLLVGGEAVLEPQDSAKLDYFVSDGTLRLDVPVTAYRAETMGGVIVGPENLTVTDQFTWAGGEIATDMTVERLRLDTGVSTLAAGSVIDASSVLNIQNARADIALVDDARLNIDYGLLDAGAEVLVSGGGRLVVDDIVTVDGATLDTDSALDLVPEAMMGVANGATLRLDGATTLAGALSAAEGTRIVVGGVVEGKPTATLETAGRLEVDAGGRMDLWNWTSATTAALAGDLILHDDAQFIATELTSSSTLDVRDTADVVAARVDVLGGRAQIAERAGVDASSGAVVVAPGAVLSGSGAVFGVLENQGAVEPGTSDTSATLTVDGDYRQLAEGSLRIRLGQLEHDALAVTGSAELGGHLNLLPDVAAAVPGEYDIIRASAITGEYPPLDGCSQFEQHPTVLKVLLRLCADLPATAEVREDEGTIRIPVTLSGLPNEAAEVGWETVNGTALAGQDYVAGDGAVVFEPGESEKFIEVKILDDDLKGGDLDFQVRLTGAAGLTIANDVTAVTILENEQMPEWVTRMLPGIGRARVGVLTNDDAYATIQGQAYRVSLATGRQTELTGAESISGVTDDLLVGSCRDDYGNLLWCWSDTGTLWESMPLLSDGKTYVVGMDGSGRVFGVFHPEGGGPVRSVVWPSPADEPLFFDAPGVVADVNARGDLLYVGRTAHSPSWYHPSAGEPIAITLPKDFAGTRVSPAALGEDGRVVGSTSNPGGTPLAWSWTSASGGTLLGDGIPTGVNSRGDVVGNIAVGPRMLDRAWVWREGVYSMLDEVGDLEGSGWGAYTSTAAITDDRVILASLGALEYDDYTHVLLYPYGQAPEPPRLELGGRMDEQRVDGAPEDRLLVVDRTVDGSTVRLTATAVNNDGAHRDPTEGLRAQFFINGELRHESEPFSLRPGTRHDETWEWDTTGLAWVVGAAAEPFDIRIALVADDGPIQALTGEVTVEPRPVVTVGGWGTGAGWAALTEQLHAVREDWHVETAAADVIAGPNGYVEAAAEQLAAAVAEARALTNAERVDVIAHSTGGVPARLFVDQYVADDARTVERLILLGTPNAGSACADLFVDDAHLEYRSDVMAAFNERVNRTHGVTVSVAAGDVEESTCFADEPGDGFSTTTSVLSGYGDAATYGVRLEEMLGDHEITYDFLLPRLTALPSTSPLDVVGQVGRDFFDGITGWFSDLMAPPQPQLLELQTLDLPAGDRSWTVTVPRGATTLGLTVSAPGEVTADFRAGASGASHEVPAGTAGTILDRSVEIETPVTGNWTITFHAAEAQTVSFAVWTEGLPVTVTADLAQLDDTGPAGLSSKLGLPAGSAAPSTLFSQTVDSENTAFQVSLRDDGTSGDAMAGDRTYSAHLADLASGYASSKVIAAVGNTRVIALSAARVGPSGDGPGGDVPRVYDILLETPYATDVTGRLRGTDPNGDALTYSVVAQPANAAVTIAEDRVLVRPDRDFVGELTFSYFADDGTHVSEPATVTVHVTRAKVTVDEHPTVGQGALVTLPVVLRGPAGILAAVDGSGIEATWRGVRDTVVRDDARYGVPVDIGTELDPGVYELLVHFPGDAFHGPAELEVDVRVAANTAPRIRGLLTPNPPEADYDTRFDVLAFDSEQAIVRYELDADGDGEWDSTLDRSLVPSVSSGERNEFFVHRYDAAGVYDARVRVTDRFGVTAERNLRVKVAEHRDLGATDFLRDHSGTPYVTRMDAIRPAPSVSADNGRYLLRGTEVYEVPGQAPAEGAVEIEDTTTGQTTRYEVPEDVHYFNVRMSPEHPLAVVGQTLLRLDSGTVQPLSGYADLRESTVSADGRWLVSHPSAGVGVAVHDLLSGGEQVIELNGSSAPRISGDGSRIVRIGNAGTGSLVWTDWQSGQTGSREALPIAVELLDLSDDGTLALVRGRGDLGPEAGDTDLKDDVYLVNLQTGAVQEVSGGTDPDALSSAPVIQAMLSGDGSEVVMLGFFEAGDHPGLYRWDVATEEAERIDVDRDGGPGETVFAGECDDDRCEIGMNPWPAEPIMSVNADGSTVEFASYANTLVPGDVHFRASWEPKQMGAVRELNYFRWEAAADPTDPTDPSAPTDPADPTDPIDPTDPSDPTNPTDPSDPGDPSEGGPGSVAGEAANGPDGLAETGGTLGFVWMIGCGAVLLGIGLMARRRAQR